MSETIEAPAPEGAQATDTLADIFDRHNAGIGHNGGPEMPQEAPAGTVRDEQGRFVAQAADKAPEAAPAAPAATNGPPEGWPANTALDWNRLNPAVQAAIRQDMEAGRLHLAPPTPPVEPFAEVLAPFEPAVKAAGLDMREYVPRVLQTAEAMDRDPVGVVAGLIQHYGIGDALLAMLAPQGMQGQPVAADPKIAALEAEVIRLRQWQGSQEQQREAQAQAEAAQQVQEFAKGREYFDLVRADMAAFVRSGMSLEKAYTAACAVNETVQARQAQAAEAKQRADAAARAAQARRGAGFNLPATNGANGARPSLEQSAGEIWDRYAGVS